MRKVFTTVASKGILAIAFLALFLSFIPFFAKQRAALLDQHSKKSATLSGMIEFKQGCDPGYYRVVLNGLFENSGFEVETQTDSTGHFILSVPPGRYLAQVVRDDCGASETIELEKNTEHMYTFEVQEFKGVEKVGQGNSTFPSRLPASVLVAPATNRVSN